MGYRNPLHEQHDVVVLPDKADQQRIRVLKAEKRVLLQALIDEIYERKMMEVELSGAEIDAGDRNFQLDAAKKAAAAIVAKARQAGKRITGSTR